MGPRVSWPSVQVPWCMGYRYFGLHRIDKEARDHCTRTFKIRTNSRLGVYLGIPSATLVTFKGSRPPVFVWSNRSLGNIDSSSNKVSQLPGLPEHIPFLDRSLT